MPFHDYLMSPYNMIEIVGMQKLLKGIFSKVLANSPLTFLKSFQVIVIGVVPKQLAHLSATGNLIHPVQCSYIVE